MSGHARGRCHRCNVVYTWRRGTAPLRGTKCPKCGEQLAQTSQNIKLPTRRYPGRAT